MCLLYDGSTRRLTESGFMWFYGFMEKPGIEPATPGLQGIALIHYTTGASPTPGLLDIGLSPTPGFGRICIYSNSCAYISCTKIKMSIAQLMFFSECNVQNVIFRFFFTRLGKGRGNSNWFPFGHVLLITETSQTIRNRILNIDQLEMKYMLVSGGSIL